MNLVEEIAPGTIMRHLSTSSTGPPPSSHRSDYDYSNPTHDPYHSRAYDYGQPYGSPPPYPPDPYHRYDHPGQYHESGRGYYPPSRDDYPPPPHDPSSRYDREWDHRGEGGWRGGGGDRDRGYQDHRRY